MADTVRTPEQPLTLDEKKLLAAYRRSKKLSYASGKWDIHQGLPTNLEVTEKDKF